MMFMMANRSARVFKQRNTTNAQWCVVNIYTTIYRTPSQPHRKCIGTSIIFDSLYVGGRVVAGMMQDSENVNKTIDGILILCCVITMMMVMTMMLTTIKAFATKIYKSRCCYMCVYKFNYLTRILVEYT